RRPRKAGVRHARRRHHGLPTPWRDRRPAGPRRGAPAFGHRPGPGHATDPGAGSSRHCDRPARRKAASAAAFAVLRCRQRRATARAAAHQRAPHGGSAMSTPHATFNRLRPPLAAGLLAVLAASGCQDHESRRAGAPAETEVLTRTPQEAPDGTAPVTLQALLLAELEAASLPGELACAFIDGGQTLLLARGDAASSGPARGMVRVAGRMHTVTAPGGFDAMLHGTRFQGPGLVIEVMPVGPPVGRGESPPVPAELVVHEAGGATLQKVSGQWQCGP